MTLELVEPSNVKKADNIKSHVQAIRGYEEFSLPTLSFLNLLLDKIEEMQDTEVQDNADFVLNVSANDLFQDITEDIDDESYQNISVYGAADDVFDYMFLPIDEYKDIPVLNLFIDLSIVNKNSNVILFNKKKSIVELDKIVRTKLISVFNKYFSVINQHASEALLLNEYDFNILSKVEHKEKDSRLEGQYVFAYTSMNLRIFISIWDNNCKGEINN